jgi:hypothetical protein
LKGAANGEVEKQRDETGGECTHVRSGENGDGMRDAEAFEIARNDPDGNDKEGSESEAEVDSVDERGVAVLATARTERLRNKSVQANEEALTEKGEYQEEAGADADGADGFGAVGKTADHHGVNDGHAHPADFGEDERESEAEGGTEFVAENGEEGHGEFRKISDIGYLISGSGWEREGTTREQRLAAARHCPTF